MRLIDADELKVQIHSRCDVCNDKDTAWCEHCCSVNDWEDYIDNAPTIEERTKGKWRKRNGYVYDYRCSCCEYIIYNGKTNFCPNCGADMRGNE